MQAAVLDDFDFLWKGDALATIIALSYAQSVVTADDLAREMRRPPHANMPGQSFAAARRLGYIEPIGYQTSASKSRKNGVIRQWRRKINKGVAA